MMTMGQWLADARRHREVLSRFVAAYHPAHRRDLLTRRDRRPDARDITAPAAEYACELARRRIAAASVDMDPVEALDHALEDGNVAAAMAVLNAAWFGVPESTTCWGVPGFAEAVSLLKDPPEEEGADDHDR